MQQATLKTCTNTKMVRFQQQRSTQVVSDSIFSQITRNYISVEK